jgi:hypothetical protein
MVDVDANGRAYDPIDTNQVVKDLQDIMEPTPEHDIKPQLVWLGHYLGLDVYIDVQPVNNSKKHIELSRRLFKKQMEEMN